MVRSCLEARVLIRSTSPTKRGMSYGPCIATKVIKPLNDHMQCLQSQVAFLPLFIISVPKLVLDDILGT